MYNGINHVFVRYNNEWIKQMNNKIEMRENN